jgi:hypothetical protein
MTAAAHTLLVHRASKAAGGGDVSRRCFEGLPAQLGVSLSGAMESGIDPVSVGARIGRAYVALGQTDGANEQNRYADTTGWTSRNPPLVVDEPGVDVEVAGEFHRLRATGAEVEVDATGAGAGRQLAVGVELRIDDHDAGRRTLDLVNVPRGLVHHDLTPCKQNQTR